MKKITIIRFFAWAALSLAGCHSSTSQNYNTPSQNLDSCDSKIGDEIWKKYRRNSSEKTIGWNYDDGDTSHCIVKYFAFFCHTTDTFPSEFYQLSNLVDLSVEACSKDAKLPDLRSFKHIERVLFQDFDFSETIVVIDSGYQNVESLRFFSCQINQIKFVGNFLKMKYLKFGNILSPKIIIDESFFNLNALAYLDVEGNVIDYDFTRLSKLVDLSIVYPPMTKTEQKKIVETHKKLPYLRLETSRGVFYFRYGKQTEL
jgi:hypothetical protein